MCKALALLFCVTVCAPLLECQDQTAESAFSPDQLDNLLAPVALYPDPLLAQLLVAATYPDEIDQAARFLRASPDPAGIDAEPWDVSVKAVAHYPEVLSWMADSLDWAVAVGQAYAWQPEDVMAAIQRLRAEARAVGNLETGPQQEVADDDGAIEIWPADDDSIYVPVYDPDVVYFGSGGAPGTGLVTFGPARPIGVWLNRDFYRFLGRCRGPGFALAALPLHLVYFTCCGLSVLFALFQWHVVNRVTLVGSAGAARRKRVDQGAGPIPQPFLARVARRLARWTTRSR